MARDQTPRSAHRPDHPESRRSRLEAGETKSLGPNVDASSTGSGPPPADIPGYTVLRELSRGGQAVVFQALQKSTHRKVAVKVLLEGPYASAAAKHRFDREVELASHLKHPHIMAVYDSGVTASGQPYYVMDYVRGVPITHYVHDNKLDVRHVLELFATACDAVNHAHQKGVIHRDLKPSNMLVDAEGNLHILDFGLAKSVTDRQESLVTVTGQLMGTLPYMSPEQTRGNPDLVDTRTDVYSLGIVLYVMLTGCYPYPVVGELSDVLHHIADTEPHSLAKAWASHQGFGVPGPKHRRTHLRCPLSGDLEVIVLKSLSKERERRYQSAGELAADVRAYLAGDPIHAKHDSGIYLLKKTLRRYRLQAMFAGVLLLLLVILFPVVLASRSRALAAESVAMQARDEEAAQREFAQSQVRRAVEAENTVTAERTKAELRLARSLVMEGDAFTNEGSFSKARVVYLEAYTLAKKLGRSPVPALAGWALSSEQGMPLMGRDGARLGAGGFETGRVSESGASVVIAPDGRTAISRDATAIAKIWDLRTGAIIRTLECKYGGIYSIALSNDSRLLLVGFAKIAAIYDFQNGEELRTLTGHSGAVFRSVFSPDGQHIATGSDDGTARLWDASTGRELKCFSLDRGSVIGLAFSPDGSQLVYSSSVVGGMTVVPVAPDRTDSRFLTDQYLEPEQTIAFCPDGKSVLAGYAAGEVRLWDIESGKITRTLIGHRGMISSVAVSPDGKKACSGCGDGTARVWDIQTGAQLRCVDAGETVSVAFTPDSEMVLTGSTDGTIRLWGVAPPRRLPFLTDGSHVLGWDVVSPDGRLGLSEIFGCHLVLWDVATGQEIHKLSGHAGGAIRAAFSPDQRTILSAAGESIRIWDVTTGKQTQSLPEHNYGFAAVAYSPDGLTGIAGSWDAIARVVNIASGQQRLALVDEDGPLSGVAIFPDGQSALTSSRDGHIRFWDLRNGQQTRKLTNPDGGTTLYLTLLKDGTGFLTGHMGSTIKLWDQRDGAVVKKYVGHLGPLSTIDVSPDSTILASHARDGTVRLWDFQSAEQLRCLPAGTPGGIGSAWFLGNNRELLYSTSNGSENQLNKLDLSMLEKCLDLEPRVVKARESLKNNPKDGEALRTFGEWWAFRDQPTWAAEMLEAARANGADISPLMLARAYWKLGRLNEAGAEFARAIERKEAPEAYLSLCRNAVLSKQPAQD